MGIIVGRWLKDGKNKVFSTQFKTARRAKIIANRLANEASKTDKNHVYEVGKPFRHGAFWSIYIHRIKVGRY